jgi:hypothetical protein
VLHFRTSLLESNSILASYTCFLDLATWRAFPIGPYAADTYAYGNDDIGYFYFPASASQMGRVPRAAPLSA